MHWRSRSTYPRGRTRRPAAITAVMRPTPARSRTATTKFSACDSHPTGRFYSPLRRESAPDLGHRARGADKTCLVDPMLQFLVQNRIPHGCCDLGVGRAVAERGLQIPLAMREEAGAELAVGRNPNSVAGRAERLGDRIDEAHLADAVGKAVALRRRGGLRGQLDERPVDLLDQRTDLAAGQHLVVAPHLVGVEW